MQAINVAQGRGSSSGPARATRRRARGGRLWKATYADGSAPLCDANQSWSGHQAGSGRPSRHRAAAGTTCRR
eukprot:1244924-Alexandrium_andersonii.AAC.1